MSWACEAPFQPGFYPSKVVGAGPLSAGDVVAGSIASNHLGPTPGGGVGDSVEKLTPE